MGIKFTQTSIVDNGLNDWKNISAILSAHEKSPMHLESMQLWKELKQRLHENKTIDQENEKQIKKEEQYWRQPLERLIELVKTLSIQNLAFRGSVDKIHCHGNGNFLKFIEYLA